MVDVRLHPGDERGCRDRPGAGQDTGREAGLRHAAKRASIYDKAADAKVQVAKAVERAKHDDKRILLMFGGDWCGWCHKLHDLFKTNREVAQILYNEYELVTIDLESPNATPLLKTCKEALSKDELQKGVGYPFLAVLDADGKVVTAQRTDVARGGRPSRPEEGRGIPDASGRCRPRTRSASSMRPCRARHPTTSGSS